MFRLVAFAIIVGACATVYPPSAMCFGLDEFVLAVQHFDPAHELGISYSSREVAFVREALKSARNTVPAIAGIHVRTDDVDNDPMSPMMYRTIEFCGGEQVWSKTVRTTDIMRGVANRIGANCECEIQTNERCDGDPAGRRTATRWSLWPCDLAESAARRSCTNTGVVNWLCSLGVGSVLLKTSATPLGDYNVNLYLVFTSPTDLEYTSKKLINSPLYRPVFGELEPRPYLGLLFGDGPSVEVVPCEGGTPFSDICFKFTVGWGDCEAGCIYSHYWTIRCHAINESPDDVWRFTASLFEEGGQPLPASMW